MPSRSWEYLQKTSLLRLQAMVPHECPLVVYRRGPDGGFVVEVLDRRDPEAICRGRFQVVATWIRGYLAAWKAER